MEKSKIESLQKLQKMEQFYLLINAGTHNPFVVCDKENFNDVTVLDAEIALKQGRKTGDGRIDILVKYSAEYIGIVELKLNEINELKPVIEYIKKLELNNSPELNPEITVELGE